jgi:ribonucleoside-diphosphate reductase alpha subunit
MFVVKRSGKAELVSFDKVLHRIQKLCTERGLKHVNAVEIAQLTITAIHDHITTSELDTFAATKCAEKNLIHPEYDQLAVALCVSNLQKNICKTFREATICLYNNLDTEGRRNQLVADDYYQLVMKYHEALEAMIDYERDYMFDFFGIETLRKSYLMRSTCNPQKNGKKEVVESPQHLFMRVALGIHGDNLEMVREVYNLISQHYYTHATPTLYNAGTPRAQLASCFLLGMDDSLDEIFETITNAAHISKWAGGVGIHMTDVRASGSEIRGTRGRSGGIVPFIKVLNATLRAVDQGGGLRKGAGAVYLDVWHADVQKFCDLRKATGEEECRARDIHLALMVPDLFMERVRSNGKWSLMCPNQCRGLSTSFGDEFEKLYLQYEKDGKFVQQVEAADLWTHIVSAQIETGEPYILYKDAINRKNNQANLGTIQSSNLCCEICEYSDQKTIAVCNLASLCLPAFLEPDQSGKLVYNHRMLHRVVQVVIETLDRVIDKNFYALDATRRSNMQMRPIGLGVQGLSDVYMRLGLAFDSPEARLLNKQIFETIYHGAVTASVKQAKKFGPYEKFEGSPFSRGQLQWHLWGLTIEDLEKNWPNGAIWNWTDLIEEVKQHGTRNSLLTALMPTATTSQIMGCNECFEPITSNVFRRKTQTGEYVVVNKILVERLIELGLWNEEIREEIIFDKGSIQNIREIPEELRNVFKTVFELGMKVIIEQSADRGPFIDQSQSMNLYTTVGDIKRITNAHFLGWTRGLKTGSYYIRVPPKVDPLKFGVDPNIIRRISEKRGIPLKEAEKKVIRPQVQGSPQRVGNEEKKVKRVCNDEICEMCSA